MIFSCPHLDDKEDLSGYNIGVTQNSLAKTLKIPEKPKITRSPSEEEEEEFKDALSDEE